MAFSSLAGKTEGYGRTDMLFLDGVQLILQRWCTCVRWFVALNELLGMLLNIAPLKLLLPQEVLQVCLGQLLPISRVLLENLQHVLPLG